MGTEVQFVRRFAFCTTPDALPNEDPTSGVPALLPAIQWVPLGTLTIYPITEQELDQLEKGTPESTYFGFSVFLLSSGISFLVSLLTTDIKSVWLFSIFLVFTLVGLIGGLMLLIVWLRLQRSTVHIAKVIRARKPPEGQQQN